MSFYEMTESGLKNLLDQHGYSSEEYCLRVARLMSLTIFSPGLLRVPIVCLMSTPQWLR